MELTGKLVNAISVDFWRPDVSAVVYVKQYDAALRVVPVYLLDNGQKYSVPSGYSANICVGKPDGTSVYNPAEVDAEDASLVYVTITQQMTAATGKARCDVEIVSGNDVGKTATFWLEVIPAAVSEDAIESGDEWQTVQGLVQEAQTAATNAATSATQAQQAAETAATEAAASAAQQAVQDVMDELEQNAVVSFNGRKGAVVPQAGDYTAEDVGALSSEKATSLVPTGAVMPFAGANAPTGWLLCDGSAVSRTTYDALFAVIGTTYGSGDGTTTFNLPDLRGRVAVGVTQNFTAGQTEGEKSSAITEDELPVITPSLKNAYSIVVDAGITVEQAGGNKFAAGPQNLSSGYFYSPYSQYGSAASNRLPSIEPFGAGEPRSNMQPSLYMQYIIKH